LAEKHGFDYEEALALFGTDNLKVTTNLGKAKGVGAGSAPKRTKPKIPLPFTGEVFDDCCRAIVFNGGLFTQCLKAPKPDSQNSLCKTCDKQAEENPNGSPPLGYIMDRVNRGEDWADPKGRRPVPYTKVMKAKKFTLEEVMAEVSNNNLNIDLTIFDDTDTEKRGRKKGGKKTEVQSVFGEDDEDDGLLGALIQDVKDSESESSDTSKTSKTSKKSKEERELEKKEKASQKSEQELMKAEEKRMKDLKKEEDKIAKEHEKRAKELQKEAVRLFKEKKDEEKRLAKEAKEQAKAVKADAKRPLKQIKEEKMSQVEEVAPVEEVVPVEEVDPLEEFEELEELEEAPPSPMSPPPEEPVVEVEPVVEPEPVVETEPVVEPVKPKMKKFKFQGVSYVVDDANIVYRKDAPKVRVGVYTKDGLVFDEKDESDEEEEEEQLSDIE